MKKIVKLVDSVLEKKVEPATWLLNFCGIIILRLYLDKFIAQANSPLFDLIMDVHNFLFFFLAISLVWFILGKIIGKKPFELAHFMLCVSLALIFPPILDMLKTGGEVFWSFYLISVPRDLFRQYVTIFGNLPSGVVYFGTKIVFIFGILALAGAIFAKTKKPWKALLSIPFTYSALFFMAAFPSIFFYLTRIISGKSIFSLYAFEIFQFFSKTRVFGLELAEPVYALAYNLNLIYFPLILAIVSYFFWKSEPKFFWSFVANLRYPQVIFHGGLLILGLGVGANLYPQNFNLTLFSLLAVFNVFLGVFLAWEASVVVNDIFDYQLDLVANPERPLQKGSITRNQYAQFGVILFFCSLLAGTLVHYKFGILLLVYQILAWFYSAPPFRLKRFVPIASILSALTLLTIFFCGFIFFSPEQKIDDLSWRLIFLLLITYAISLPVKDFKDIAGDKKDGVRTIPVIFGEEKSRLIVASGFFISFVLSVFLLREPRLFWWAILFGSLAYLIMLNRKIHPRNVFWWILAVVFLYGLILVNCVLA